MPRKSREREREQQRKERKRHTDELPERSAAAEPQAEPSAATPDPAALQLAAEVAEQLGETEEVPRGTILRAVTRLGAEATQALVQEALAIEAQGGQWLGDGSRKRTPGGVFFRLVRDRAEKLDRIAIFYPEYQQVDPLTADELGGLLADVASWPRARPQQVRFRIAGRPSKIPASDLPPETP